MKIFISAAETSSDAHGAQLLRALKTRLGSSVKLNVFGIGGPKLQAEGLRPVVDARELLTMGVGEVLVRLPKILGHLKTVVQAIEEEQPDLIIVLDYPDFHFRLAKKVKHLGIPMIYYIPPKVWVWRKSRIQSLKKLFDHVLCIFPFEEALYQEARVPVTYVGNPLTDELPTQQPREEIRRQLGIGAEEIVATLMPGSRPAELHRHLEVMLDSVQQTALTLRSIGKISPEEFLRVLIPLPSTISLQEQKKRVEVWCKSKKRLAIQIQISLENSHEALMASNVALIKSGTSTLEAALLGCPHAIIYKTGFITKWAYRAIVRYKGPVGLSNLVLNWKAKPPFLFREFTLDDVQSPVLSRELLSLILNEQRQQEIQEGIQTIRRKISQASPSAKAADEVLRVLSKLQGQEHRIYLRSKKLPKWILVTGSFAWSLANACIRFLVRRKILKTTKLPSRVISVGNLQVGGAGKTPLVALIANEASKRGLKVCILTRGYKGTWEDLGGIISPGEGPVDPQKSGDEAALLHELCPQAWIGVGADRITQYQQVIELSDYPIDLVLLDDGFQHWKIEKDLEVVALTSTSRNEILHRDFLRSIKQSDLIVWTKGDQPPKTMGRPLVRVQYTLSPLGAGESIWLVTAVGDQSSVRKTFEKSGYKISKHLTFEDHYFYRPEQIEKILTEAREAGCKVGLTGKDWVKWKFCLPQNIHGNVQDTVGVFEPKLVFEQGKEIWEQKLWGSLH